MYLLIHKKKLNLENTILKKGAIELYCENIIFALCGIGVAYSDVFYKNDPI